MKGRRKRTEADSADDWETELAPQPKVEERGALVRRDDNSRVVLFGFCMSHFQDRACSDDKLDHCTLFECLLVAVKTIGSSHSTVSLLARVPIPFSDPLRFRMHLSLLHLRSFPAFAPSLPISVETSLQTPMKLAVGSVPNFVPVPCHCCTRLCHLHIPVIL